MTEVFDTEMIWTLRALAQDAPSQRELYPPFAVVADELVLDFEQAYSNCSDAFWAANPDIAALDAHILSKSGVLEFWDDEALDHGQFWKEIRRLAREALQARGLTTFAPSPSAHTYGSENEVYVAGRPMPARRQSRFQSAIRWLKDHLR